MFEEHGMGRTRMYKKWQTMRERCYNPNKDNYAAYGGKGIDVCEEWNTSFVTFMDWCNNNGYYDGCHIDRIDSTKGYSPDNCRLVSPAENMRARCTTKLTEEDIPFIRMMYNHNVSTKNIAMLFEVSRQNVADVVFGRTWREV